MTEVIKYVSKQIFYKTRDKEINILLHRRLSTRIYLILLFLLAV